MRDLLAAAIRSLRQGEPIDTHTYMLLAEQGVDISALEQHFDI